MWNPLAISLEMSWLTFVECFHLIVLLPADAGASNRTPTQAASPSRCNGLQNSTSSLSAEDSSLQFDDTDVDDDADDAGRSDPETVNDLRQNEIRTTDRSGVGSGSGSTASDDNTNAVGLTLMQKWQMKYPGRKIVPHTCSTCGKQFLQAVQLRKHLIKHAESAALTTNGGDDAMSTVVEFPFSCCVCRRHFLFSNDLKRHLITHSDDRPYSCIVCRRPFKREDDLAKHMKVHGGVRPYECDECGERLESATKLRKHVRRAHGDKYRCTACQQYFVNRSALVRHKRDRHAAGEYFFCPVWIVGSSRPRGAVRWMDSVVGVCLVW